MPRGLPRIRDRVSGMLIGVRRVELSRPVGVRWIPDEQHGVGVLVLAGSSGRVDESRARVIAEQGCIAESVQWFGGPGQNAGPWEIPLETFQRRVADLARDCGELYVVGTSFGAEAALVTAAQTPGIAGVVAFAPSDVVWAGIDPAGRQASHWTLDGYPLPFIAFDESWQPHDDPPGFRSLYLRSRHADPAALAAAAIPVERIPSVITVAGKDDQVWPSDLHAENIRSRRAAHGRETTAVTDDEAGHRAVLPGEPVMSGGVRMRRGGTETADRRLGQLAWGKMLPLLAGGTSAPSPFTGQLADCRQRRPQGFPSQAIRMAPLVSELLPLAPETRQSHPRVAAPRGLTRLQGSALRLAASPGGGIKHVLSRQTCPQPGERELAHRTPRGPLCRRVTLMDRLPVRGIDAHAAVSPR